LIVPQQTLADLQYLRGEQSRLREAVAECEKKRLPIRYDALPIRPMSPIPMPPNMSGTAHDDDGDEPLVPNRKKSPPL
jgi:hypothetical protein